MNPPPGITALPNGQWTVTGDSHLGAWALQKGTIVTDPNLLAFLAEHIPPKSVVWAVGANIGDHAFEHLANGHHVIAFEPHPVTYRCLEHNCPSAVSYNIAASHEAGSLRFKGLDNVGASRVHPDGEWSVPALALDDMPALPPPAFVSIDVEGWEPNVITGMAGTITRHRPVLFVEFNEGALRANGFSGEGLLDQIQGLGYSRSIIYPADAKWGDPQFDLLFFPGA